MTVLKIIDVSEHNGVIDWERVQPQIDGAIIRCGYGTDKASNDDKHWRRNADECTRLGIPFGVYLYSYAKTVEAARSEAAHVLRLVEGYTLSYPIYFDAEQAGTEHVCNQTAKTFCDIIEGAGYFVGIYSTAYWFAHYLKDDGRYTRWVASWGTNNGQPQVKPAVKSMAMWQYTSVGKIPGVNGNVDVSLCYEDFPAIINPTKKEDKPVEQKPWYIEDGSWEEGEHLGIVDGTRPTDPATRAEVNAMILRALRIAKESK